VATQLFDLDPATYVPHPLHASERVWSETNCYVDFWIEVLHVLGLEPLAACAFTLSGDFDGDQWLFFKFPLEDLRILYGIDVSELNTWRPMDEHIEEQLGFGRLVTIDADAWYMPDTAGVTYHLDHSKTGIVPQKIDREARVLGYFHNAGYWELSGDDYDGVLHLGPHADPFVMSPYTEVVRLDRMRREGPTLDEVLALMRDHLARRPVDNPIARLRKRIESDLPWLAEAGMEGFHLYAFGACRQTGANAELAASFVDWLAPQGVDVGDAAARFRSVSETMKSVQMTLARAARGRTVDLNPQLDVVERDWDAAISALVERHGA
jgi:hypothetical protein